jgi:hypothetical protein
MAFVDEDGNDFSVTSYTFEAYLKDERSDTDANAAVTIPTSSFTISGNDASFTLSSANNNRSEGIDYLDVRMFDGSGNRTKVFFARVSYILAESGSSTALTTTVGSTDLTVTITHASGQTAVANVMSANGDLIQGSGSGSYRLLKNNLAGTAAPDADNDTDESYTVSSMWYDTTNDKAYVCLDNTDGAAVWTEVTAGAAGGEANTASSQGSGASIYYQKSGVDLQFNGLKSENNLMTVTVDAVSNDVEFTVNEANIDHDALTNFLSTEHFTEGSIDHTNITNIGTNAHSAIDTHIASTNIHYAQSSITTVGTIGTGVWQGTAITNNYIDTGITDDKIIEIDDADAADNDYAKFTANGLEGRSYSEVKTDLSLNNVENTALSTWAGSTNLTTLGTIATGTWNGTSIADANVDNDITIQTTSAMTGTNANFSGTVTANKLTDGTISITGGNLTGATGVTATNLTGTLQTASQTNITAVGTIATGVWNGTSITDANVDNDLTISGGTIDNSAIGASTASTGVFTSVTVNTQLKNVNLTISSDDITNADTIQAAEQIYTDTTSTAPSTKNITIDFNTGEAHSIDLESVGANIDLTLSNIVTGNSYIIELIQGATEREISSVTPAVDDWLDGTTVNVTATENATTVLGIWKAPSGALKVNYADYY